MRYIIKIADIFILADVPYFLHPNDSTNEFISPASGDEVVDLRLELRPVKALPKRSDVWYESPRRIYVGVGENAGTFFSSFPGKTPYAFVSRQFVHDGYLFCEYLPGNEKYMDYSRNLFTIMDIEATLLDFDALILHASLIRWKGMGILFTAPPGTGKSTQAELWERYKGADILNGDRAAMRRINGVYRAFGLPYAGTSGIYRNESAPITVIVALRQAKENRIRELHGSEAFRYIYPETMIHRWDPVFERHATDILLEILEDIPVFLLECTPDIEAVSLLRNTLIKYMKQNGKSDI